MENEEKIQKPPNPRKGANFLSLLTFSYTIPIFIKGFNKDLTEADIPSILKQHSSKTLGDALEKSWQKEVNNKHPSLWKALARVFLAEFVVLGLLLFFLEAVLKIVQSLSLANLITLYSHSDNMNFSSAYMHAGIIVACSYLNVLMGHNYMQLLHVFGMKLRIACCSLIYRKSLRIKKTELGCFSVGEMVNLLSNDVNRCDRAANHAHNLWVCPLETIVIMYILNDRLGFVSIIGIIFMILFVPLQLYMGKKNFTYRLQTAFRTDERIRLMSEVISGIQVIKMYAWEQSFTKVVEMVRKLEIRYVQYAAYIKGLLSAFSGFTSRCALFLTIITHVLLGNTPRAEYVFVVTSFYNILRQAITVHFPGGITELSELKVSITRLQTFLMHEEVDQNLRSQRDVKVKGQVEEEKRLQGIHNNKSPSNIDVNTKIYLKHVSAQWSSNHPPVLSNVNIKFQEKQLTAIIGPVGSGKTSLLQALLRELPLSSGVLHTDGTISYASQDPWVFAGTIQQNILFGQIMNTDRYQQVIKVCALERDFKNLPHADKTLVGSRGISLSGGQRARINLARAIYKKADIYLLDDPLSAVDACVGRHLFSECISAFLKQKCVILVTHQLQYLKKIESIYLLENGTVVTHGSYNDLRNSGSGYAALLNTIPILDETDSLKKRPFFDNTSLSHAESITAEKEGIASGSISNDIYAMYMRAGGSLWRLLIILLVFVVTYTASNGSDYFLAYWVNVEQTKTSNSSNTTYSLDLPRKTYIIIYMTLIFVMIICFLLGILRFYNFCMKASRSLHNTMLNSIINAPMKFFNINNPGRILNRFSKDMGMVDDVLPSVAVDCITITISVFAIMVTVCFLNPWMIIATSIILTLFYLLRMFYLATSRSVKRLEGRTRSPVFGHMSASLEGLTTIRAFGAEKILENEFDSHQDLHTSVWYTFLVSSRAFGFWLDLVCVTYTAITTFSFFIMGSDQFGGSVGLAITQAIALTGTFQWGMRQCCEFQNLMTSVERVIDYIHVESEPETWKLIPAASWPQKGCIEFQSVTLKYTETEPSVLKQLSFTIFCKEKVGIVGRTGAGKTSLIHALFRLSTIDGSIFIDGIDISTVPLYNLRSNISIIPQEPVLFSGSLRKNLDPFHEHTDEELWKALEEVDLKRLISDLPLGLKTVVAEGGANFSVGQRQLLCLTRASLRKNKILILDEATASLDPKTDDLIQRTIRNKFCNCTVLTIAHRLNTIIDSDRVMVIEDGQVVEFDHPYKLLLLKSGLFHSMVEQAGHTSMESLIKISKENYEKYCSNT